MHCFLDTDFFFYFVSAKGDFHNLNAWKIQVLTLYNWANIKGTQNSFASEALPSGGLYC